MYVFSIVKFCLIIKHSNQHNLKITNCVTSSPGIKFGIIEMNCTIEIELFLDLILRAPFSAHFALNCNFIVAFYYI